MLNELSFFIFLQPCCKGWQEKMWTRMIVGQSDEIDRLPCCYYHYLLHCSLVPLLRYCMYMTGKAFLILFIDDAGFIYCIHCTLEVLKDCCSGLCDMSIRHWYTNFSIVPSISLSKLQYSHYILSFTIDVKTVGIEREYSKSQMKVFE